MPRVMGLLGSEVTPSLCLDAWVVKYVMLTVADGLIAVSIVLFRLSPARLSYYVRCSAVYARQCYQEPLISFAKRVVAASLVENNIKLYYVTAGMTTVGVTHCLLSSETRGSLIANIAP